MADVIQIERTVAAPAPAEAVFAYLLDFTHAEEWDAGTVTCVRLSGDGGVGTSYRNTSRFLGRTTTLEYVVQEVRPPTSFRIQGRNATVTSTDTITVTAHVQAASAVVYRARFEFHGAARWLEPVLRLPIRRLADRTEQTLGAALSRIEV